MSQNLDDYQKKKKKNPFKTGAQQKNGRTEKRSPCFHHITNLNPDDNTAHILSFLSSVNQIDTSQSWQSVSSWQI